MGKLKFQNTFDMPSTSQMKNKKAVKKATAKKNTTRSERAGVVFPVGRVNRMMKQGRFAKQLGAGGAVFMAAALNYLTSEILELAGEITAEKKKTRITPQHIQLAIHGDEELTKLMAFK